MRSGLHQEQQPENMQKRLDPDTNVGAKQEKPRLKRMYNMVLIKNKQKTPETTLWCFTKN